MIWAILQVAAGGAVGAVLRYLTVVATIRALGPAFPWGTLTVNVIGSFAMGYLAVVVAGGRFSPLLMTGLLGGFTTFSAFSLETVTLWERGALTTAAVYVAASVGLAVAGLVGGMALARAVAQ